MTRMNNSQNEYSNRKQLIIHRRVHARVHVHSSVAVFHADHFGIYSDYPSLFHLDILPIYILQSTLGLHFRCICAAQHLLLLWPADIRNISRLRSIDHQTRLQEGSIAAITRHGQVGRLSRLAGPVCRWRVFGRPLIPLDRPQLDVGSHVGGFLQAL